MPTDKNALHDFLLRVRQMEVKQQLHSFFRRQTVSAILLLIGIGLLGYVGHEYWSMHREQQMLRRQWITQQSAPSSKLTATNKDDGLTRVSIPKINLDLIVVEGTNHKALRLGPGHLDNTPLPGDAGNSVISAHRDTFFRHIYELAKGDDIQIRRNGRTYTFQVMGKKIVQPDDLSVVRKTPDTRLTLITCYPIYYIGPAPKRLIVTAKLVDNNSQDGQRAQATAPKPAGQGP